MPLKTSWKVKMRVVKAKICSGNKVNEEHKFACGWSYSGTCGSIEKPSICPLTQQEYNNLPEIDVDKVFDIIESGRDVTKGDS